MYIVGLLHLYGAKEKKMNILKTFLLIPAFAVLTIMTTGLFWGLNIDPESIRFAAISFISSVLYVLYFNGE